jgi:hypothetical protein
MGCGVVVLRVVCFVLCGCVQLLALRMNVQRIRANQEKLSNVFKLIKDSQDELATTLQELGKSNLLLLPLLCRCSSPLTHVLCLALSSR